MPPPDAASKNVFATLNPLQELIQHSPGSLAELTEDCFIAKKQSQTPV